jgi:glutaredoxin
LIFVTRYIQLFLILTLFLFSQQADAEDNVFPGNDGRVDLSKTISFDEYKKTGTDEHVRNVEERFGSFKIAPSFAEGAKKIDTPLTLLMIGMMYCPDCKVVSPFMEAIANLNPKIKTRYIVRNDTPGAREFMQLRTGRTNMPSIFVVSDDGAVLSGAYVETPERVTALLASAADDKARDKIWDDFHLGVYDEDVQHDLIDLIKNAKTGSVE